MKKTRAERAQHSDEHVAQRERSGARTPSLRKAPRAVTSRVLQRPCVKATLELALLGLIAETPGVSGYDIVKIFELSMAHYWHAHATQIYPTLERMEKSRIINRRRVAQSNRPNKWVYTINPSGMRLLTTWLESGFEGISLKHPPLLRSRFMGNLGPDGAIAALEEEREAWRTHLKIYRQIEKDHFAGGRSHRDVSKMFSWFTLRRGIDWMEENIAWCNWAIGEIERKRTLFKAPNMKSGLKPIRSMRPSIG